MDKVLGIVCVILGLVLGLLGIALACFGLYTLSVGPGGGWWIPELVYIVMGVGFVFIGVLASRLGLELQREHSAATRGRR